MTSVDQLLERFGRRLASYRVSRRLKQSELAELAGVDRTTLSRLEKGRGTIDTLARVLTALEISERMLDVVPDTRLDPLDPMAGRGLQRRRVRDRQIDDDETSGWNWDSDGE